MDWCDDQGIDYVFGLPGNAVLTRAVEAAADDIRTHRAETANPCLRGYTEIRYAAKTWKTERRACARIEATTLGLDIRFTGRTGVWFNCAPVIVRCRKRSRLVW